MSLFTLALVVMGMIAASPSPHDAVKPGALVAQFGTILVVEDVVTVQYNVQNIREQADSFRHLLQVLTATRVQTQVMRDARRKHDGLYYLLTSLVARINKVHSRILTCEADFPGTNTSDDTLMPTNDTTNTARNRTRRGLFNFMGIISKQLFGTAMADDVTALGRKVEDMSRIITTNGKVIQKIYSSLKVFQDTLNEVITQSNKVTVLVQYLQSEEHDLVHFLLLQDYLRIAEELILDMNTHISTMVSNLVDAGLGRVNTKLFPLVDLYHAIQVARDTYNLQPIFPEAQAEYYYPLMESVLTPSTIMIHIPMMTSMTFTAWKLVPFPLQAGDTLIMINKNPEIIVVADDFSLIDTIPATVLDSCMLSLYHMYVCSACSFIFKVADESLCELTLIKTNASEALTQCSYTPVEGSGLFHVHFQGFQYFYFDQPTSVTMLCKNSRSNVMANGYYVAPDYCAIRSKIFTSLPTHHHMAFITNLSTEIINFKPLFEVNFSKLSLVSDRIKLLSYMNISTFDEIFDNKLPMYLSHEYLYPSVFVPILLVVLGMSVVVFCLYKLYSKHVVVVKQARRRRDKEDGQKMDPGGAQADL